MVFAGACILTTAAIAVNTSAHTTVDLMECATIQLVNAFAISVGAVPDAVNAIALMAHSKSNASLEFVKMEHASARLVTLVSAALKRFLHLVSGA